MTNVFIIESEFLVSFQVKNQHLGKSMSACKYIRRPLFSFTFSKLPDHPIYPLILARNTVRGNWVTILRPHQVIYVKVLNKY